MPVIQLFPIRTFTFTNLAASQSQTITVIRALDVSRWREATLLLRVHSKTVTPASPAAIAVALSPISLTSDDPSISFVASAAAATISITSSLPTSQPSLMTQSLSANFGSQLTLTVTGTQHGTPNTITAVLSAELSVKA